MAVGSLLRRSTATVALLALAACTSDVLTPTARVDHGARVNAISRSQQARVAPVETAAAYPAPVEATQPVSGAMSIPAEGVNMDAMLGAEPTAQQPVVGLAQEQSLDIAEGTGSQPVVDGIGTDEVRQVSVPVQAGSPIPPLDGDDPDLPPLAQSQPQQVAMLPRAQNPVLQSEPEPELRSEPRMSRPVPSVMPSGEVACRQALKQLGVVYQDIPAISSGGSCGIAYPIKVSQLSGGIKLKPAITVACPVTVNFAKWVKYELAPSTRYRYLSGLSALENVGGYSCRTMNSRRGAAMSEHARGNAIDLGRLTLNSGKRIDIRSKGLFAFRERGLLKSVRGDSCKYFTTVLGPGSDRYHKDHFHFDLRARKSKYRHCSL
ncbi:extensin family protein [Rhizobium sp. CFBP 8762]|uniref:extensin-like domain-containing protein n=1 Tax=Rhizobium sp. CFBP 8762 TaxID=2775279 RepID=UPI00177B986A|nr:extensin family protein [Rhizobium sp. CFBP 8762]MBD8555863.1 extensin family protein [Rhizobium sp. CFBP 8762]